MLWIWEIVNYTYFVQVHVMLEQNKNNCGFHATRVLILSAIISSKCIHQLTDSLLRKHIGLKNTVEIRLLIYFLRGENFIV